MIAVRDKTNVLALGLLGDDFEAEAVRHGARLLLREAANGQQHARQDGAIDSPEEVGLILGVIEPAM